MYVYSIYQMLRSGARFIRTHKITNSAMSSPACCVYDAKEYLLHAQNALLVALLSGVPAGA